ncbi:MAG TPA: hypothetical protein VK763_07390 [Terriglobales bacterium]|jgi:hypothetical protein|nr:hypothetical protein [Terriglobales bacterium]
MEFSGIGTLGIYLILAFVLPGFCYTLVFALCFPGGIEWLTDWLKEQDIDVSLPTIGIVGGLLLSSVCFWLEILVVRDRFERCFPNLCVHRLAWIEAAGKSSIYAQLLAGDAFMHFNIAVGVLLIFLVYLVVSGWGWLKASRGGDTEGQKNTPRCLVICASLLLVIFANLKVSSFVSWRAKDAIDGAVRVSGITDPCLACSSHGISPECLPSAKEPPGN